MTLEKANERHAVQALNGGGYIRYAAKLVCGEVLREHGQAAIDQIVASFEPEKIFGSRAETEFK